MDALDLGWIREQFPALRQQINGQSVIFFDGPGGTQVPKAVIEAMGGYLLKSNANAHGSFITSERTDALVTSARRAIADLLGCNVDEVVFGPNMTTLTFTISRAISRELQPGGEIFVTKLDHYANVSPWQALEERGVIVRTVDVNLDDYTFNLADLEQQLNERTRLVAVGYASNAVVTISDVTTVSQLAHRVGALVFVDVVHYAPYGALDVGALDYDFLACSGYKFFDPHIGILYGKWEHLERLPPYKVQPAPNEVPSRWQSGIQNYEGMTGLVETINYLAVIGRHVSPTAASRAALVAGMNAIQSYERELSQSLLSGLLEFAGITDLNRLAWRTPTVGIRLQRHTPYSVAKQLGDRGPPSTAQQGSLEQI